MARRAVGEQHDLVPAFRQRNEQRQQNRADEQPMADLDVDRHRSADRPQHEADRNRQHVDDDDVLQQDRSKDLQPERPPRPSGKPARSSGGGQADGAEDHVAATATGTGSAPEAITGAL